MAASAASPMAVLRPGPLTPYWRFQRAVAKAQLAAWLPAGRQLLIDISGPHRRLRRPGGRAGGTPCCGSASAAGPRAPRPAPGSAPSPRARTAGAAGGPGALARGPAGGPPAGTRPAGPPTAGRAGQPGVPRRRLRGRGHRRGRRAVPVLVAEDLAAEITRVLRPGGRTARQRGLPGAGHGHPRRAASLGRAHRRAQRRGRARPLAGRHDHPLLRRRAPQGPADRGRARSPLASSGRARCCHRRWWITCCSGPGRHGPAGQGRTSAGQDRTAGASPDESFGISLLAAARKPALAPLSSVRGGPVSMAAVPLGLAANAPGRLRPGVQPPLGNGGAAVDAHPVGAALDPHERGRHQPSLRWAASSTAWLRSASDRLVARVRGILRRARAASSRCSPSSTGWTGRARRTSPRGACVRWQCPRGFLLSRQGGAGHSSGEPPRSCSRSQNSESGAESEGRYRSLVLAQAGGGPAARAGVPRPPPACPFPPASGASGLIRPGPLLRT